MKERRNYRQASDIRRRRGTDKRRDEPYRVWRTRGEALTSRTPFLPTGPKINPSLRREKGTRVKDKSQTRGLDPRRRVTSAPSVFPKLDSFFKGAKNQSKRTEEKRRARARTHCAEVSWELARTSRRVWRVSDGPSRKIRFASPGHSLLGPPHDRKTTRTRETVRRSKSRIQVLYTGSGRTLESER